MMKLALTIILDIEGEDPYCNIVNEFEFIFPHTMMRMTRNCDDNDFDPVQMSQ